MKIQEITYQECLPLWSLLWANRVSPIEPTSAMLLPNDPMGQRVYSNIIGSPIFLGVYDNDTLVGVNSYHTVGNQTRSRGLYVRGSHRGQGIGELLLRETIKRTNQVWSYPKQEALNVYLKAGFKLYSEAIVDDIENKTNFYVTYGKD